MAGRTIGMSTCYSYRRSLHKSMRHTPYEVMLGRAPPSEDRVATESILMGKWVQELHRRRPGLSGVNTSLVEKVGSWQPSHAMG